MAVADVKQIYEPDLARICDTLKLSREFAVIAMRKFNWCATNHEFRFVGHAAMIGPLQADWLGLAGTCTASWTPGTKILTNYAHPLECL